MIKKVLLGFLVLIAGVITYHFYAAANAERALDESIQSIAVESGLDMTISYASLDVNPFTGDILFSDINIIGDETIQRGSRARIDLTYRDFLYFMVWGTEAGLRQVEEGVLELRTISHTSRSTLEEFKAEQVTLNYRGNLWELIVLGITGRPSEIRHLVDASGENLTFSLPTRAVGRISADSLGWQTRFGSGPASLNSSPSNLTLSQIIWTPVESFQQRYRFFIQGFGYSTGAIPLERLSMHYDFRPGQNLLSVPSLSLTSELFTAGLSGTFAFETDTTGSTRIDSLSIQISEMSPRFQNVVTQLQNLFGVEIPGGGDEVHLLINGSVEEPEIEFGS